MIGLREAAIDALGSIAATKQGATTARGAAGAAYVFGRGGDLDVALETIREHTECAGRDASTRVICAKLPRRDPRPTREELVEQWPGRLARIDWERFETAYGPAHATSRQLLDVGRPGDSAASHARKLSAPPAATDPREHDEVWASGLREQLCAERGRFEELRASGDETVAAFAGRPLAAL